MPIWGRRESYAVVTNTVVVLVVIGASAYWFRDLILPPEPNDLAAFSEAFLKRASRQSINWRTSSSNPFEEALKLNRPVMVLASYSASATARRFDDEVFSKREVSARLNQEYVCVRIDLSNEPEWHSAFLPISRATSGVESGFTIWFFRPDGTLLTWIGRRSWTDRTDSNDFLGRLNDVSDSWRQSTSDDWLRAERDQKAERELLRSGRTKSVLDFSLVAPERIRPFFQWSANDTYRKILQGEEIRAIADVKQNLSSPRFDLIDGGFFRLSDGKNKMQVEYDKDAVTNAEMAALCAKIWAASNDPVFLYAYRRAIESLAMQFMVPGHWTSSIACEIEPGGRSKRHSFGPGKIRVEFSESAKRFSNSVGLNSRDNPLAVPYLFNADALMKDQKAISQFINEVRSDAKNTEVLLSDDDILDSSAFVVARTIEAALVTEDEQSLLLALGWANELARFRVGKNDVLHSTKGAGRNFRSLNDYVAYADAKLWQFNATGDPTSIIDGEIVLRRALELFSRNTDTDIVLSTSTDSHLGPLDLEMTPIIDGYSGIADLLRVSYLYAHSLEDIKLQEFCHRLVERLANATNLHSEHFSSFFVASYVVEKNLVTKVPFDAASNTVGVQMRTRPFDSIVRRSSSKIPRPSTLDPIRSAPA